MNLTIKKKTSRIFKAFFFAFIGLQSGQESRKMSSKGPQVRVKLWLLHRSDHFKCLFWLQQNP